MENTAISLTFILFTFGTPVVVMFAISRLSGWDKLAARYPRTGPAPKALTIFGYGSFNRWIGYNGGLIISADDNGLFLATWPVLMSWCHAPVFIPWKAIAGAKARRLLWSVYYHFELRGAPGIDFALRKNDFELVRAYLVKHSAPVGDRS